MMKFLGLLFFSAACSSAVVFAYNYRNDFCAMMGWIISAIFFLLTTMKIVDKININRD